MRHLLLAAVLALSAPALAVESPETPVEALVLVGEPLRELAIPLPEAALEDLRRGRWALALKDLEDIDSSGWDDHELGDLAFLRAWCLVHSDKGGEAVALLDQLDLAATAPPAYVDLVRGEVLWANGDGPGALRALQGVPEDAAVYVRASVVRAEILREVGRTSEAWPVYEAVAARPDPVNGNPIALLALAKRYGAGSEEAYPYLRRIRTWYPGTE